MPVKRVLKETGKNKLMVFERKVLRKIFGPTKERDGTWRIKTNDELDKLTLRLLISYIYMELIVKPEMLTSYIYGPTFGNAETVSFHLLHNVSTLNQCREVSSVTFVCKHFAS